MLARRLSLVLAVLLAMGLSACEKAGEKTARLKAEDFEGIDESGEVRLISAGAGDKRLLRYDMSAGQSLTNTLEQRTKSKVDMGGAKMDVDMGMRFEMGMKVAGLEGEEGRVEFQVEDFGLIEDATSPMMMGAQSELGTLMRGMRGTQRQDARGRLLGMDIDTSTFPPQMAQVMTSMEDAFSQMNPLLPEEAVGKGASWQVFQVISAAGIELKQRMDVKLVDMDATTATLEMTVLQQGDMQLAKAMGMPPGTKLEVSEMNGKGRARLVLDTGLFVPKEMDMTIDSKGKMSIEVGATKQKMSMKTTAEVKLRAAPR